LGAKRNWADSEDLCVMFKGTYTDKFYRAIRDALHAEVAGWNCKTPSAAGTNTIRELWTVVESLEAVSRNEDATQLPNIKCGSPSTQFSVKPHFVSLQSAPVRAGEIHE
jgi:hypothetical protein